jgi:protein-S-isoprenylcysteine O-methyltransferase Ste14
MKRWEEFVCSWSPWVSGGVLGVTMVAQIALSFILSNPSALPALKWLGYVAWTLSAIFGIVPIIAFRVKGRVPEGKNYMHTTVLVDTGIYAIVRHPQYLAGVLISIALTLITQHWLIASLGAVSAGVTYLDALRADRDGIEKFGAAYERYMQQVPRLNFVAGLLRLARQGGSGR